MGGKEKTGRDPRIDEPTRGRSLDDMPEEEALGIIEVLLQERFEKMLAAIGGSGNPVSPQPSEGESATESQAIEAIRSQMAAIDAQIDQVEANILRRIPDLCRGTYYDPHGFTVLAREMRSELKGPKEQLSSLISMIWKPEIPAEHRQALSDERKALSDKYYATQKTLADAIHQARMDQDDKAWEARRARRTAHDPVMEQFNRDLIMGRHRPPRIDDEPLPSFVISGNTKGIRGHDIVLRGGSPLTEREMAEFHPGAGYY